MHEFACVPGFYCYGYCYCSPPPLFYGPGASLHMTVLRASTYSSLGVEKKNRGCIRNPEKRTYGSTVGDARM